MLDLNTGFALVVQLMNTLVQKNTAQWNFQFDTGKQRRNTHALIRVSIQEHAHSILW